MNQLMGGAVLVGILTAMWTKVRSLLYRAYSLLIVEAKVKGDLATALKAYCWNNFKRSPFGERYYVSNSEFVRPVKRIMFVGFERLGSDPILFWNRWRPMLLGSQEVNNGGNVVAAGIDESMVRVTFIRGLFNLDRLLIAALDSYNAKFCTDDVDKKNRVKRFSITRWVGAGNRRNTGSGGDGPVTKSSTFAAPNITNSLASGEARLLKWRIEDVGADRQESKKALDALAFPPKITKMILEMEHWLKSEDWYRSKQIPWTRGWLIYGKPGTGKTSLVRAIAEDYDLPVYVFDIASMSNSEFMYFWSQMQQHAPCIALLEDVDAVFHGRENVLGEQGGGLTFDCLLNALGGIETANGILKVITTNHPETLDEAIGVPQEDTEDCVSSRPGRMDQAFEVPVLDETCRRVLAERILCDCPQHIERLVGTGDGQTGAQFVYRCTQIALREHWKKLKEHTKQVMRVAA